MKAEKHPKLRAYRIAQLRNRILTPRTGIHLSDCDTCPDKVYYRRTCPEIETPERSLLFFFSGICAEAWLAPDPIEPREKDGIVGSADDKTMYGYGEIKSTRCRSDYFKPATTYPHWIFRTKGYCNIYEVSSWNLEVFFWVGNRGNVPIAYDAWKLTFTVPELRAQWKEALIRRDVLKEAFDNNYPPSDAIDIKENGWLVPWMCKSCEFKDEVCTYQK